MVFGAETLSAPVKISLLQPIGAMQVALAYPFSFSSTARRLLMWLKPDSSLPSFREPVDKRSFEIPCFSIAHTRLFATRSTTGAIGSTFSLPFLQWNHGEISKMGAISPRAIGSR